MGFHRAKEISERGEVKASQAVFGMNEALRGMSRMRNQFSVEKKKEKKKKN